MTRQLGQRVAGGFRYQFRDPATGARRSVRAASQAELHQRIEAVKGARSELRYGLTSAAEAARLLRRAVGVGFRVRDVWEPYRQGVRVASAAPTDNAWEKLIEPFLGDKLAVDLNESVMREWVTTLERTMTSRKDTYAPKTIELAFQMLAAAFRQAVDAKRLGEVPWGRWRPRLGDGPRKPREAARSFEELAVFFEKAREADVRHWRHGTYSQLFFSVVFLAYQGVRQAEAAGLGWDCVEIDQEPYVLHVRFQAPKGWENRTPGERPRIPPKGKKHRIHGLHPTAAAVLRYQRDQLKKHGWYRPDGPVFPDPRTGTWRRSGRVIKPDTFRSLLRAAGVENVSAWTPHSLRHSTATITALMTGGDLRYVQSVTGHSDLTQVMGYVHSAGRSLSVAKFPELPAALMGGAGVDVLAVGHELGAASPVPLLPPASPPAPVPWTPREAEALEREDRDDRARKTFDELAAKWILDGRPGVRPVGVTEAVRRAYSRAYQAARYEGKPKEEAKQAGKRARRAALGAWGKARAAAERATTGEA